MKLYKRERRIKKLSFTGSFKSTKYILVTLTCLMLVSPLIASSVQAQFNPPVWPFPTLHFIVQNIHSGANWEMAAAIKAELGKIGIPVEIVYKAPELWWSDLYVNYYDVLYDDDPVHGWDMFFWEWWGAPTDMMWFESMMHYTPPESWNIAGWNNSRADHLCHQAVVSMDDADRIQYARKLQEEVAWDQPYIAMYYLSSIMPVNKRLHGYYDELFGWNVHQWSYDYPAPGGNRSVTYADADSVIRWNPHFMYNYLEEFYGDMVWDRLYTLEKKPDGTIDECPMLAKESLQAKHFTTNASGTFVTIPIRDDVWWVEWDDDAKKVVKTEQLTAADVQMTYQAILDPQTADVAHWDLDPYVESVKALNATNRIQLKLTGTMGVGMFECILANEWGLQILPMYKMGDIPHADWYTHKTNREFGQLPSSGPFVPIDWKTDESLDFVANPFYFWGKPQIHTFRYKIITDPVAQLEQLETEDIDFASDIDLTPAARARVEADPNIIVREAEVPCTEFIALNLRHPVLTNRYVRQAIAHCIPIQHIIQDLLPAVGGAGAPPRGWIWPMMSWAYYPELESTVYDLAEAERLLDMWRYSNDPANIAKSYVGDADFSGLVDMDDFLIWREIAAGPNPGTPANWPWYQGDGIDPDFDADGDADIVGDLPYWRTTTGTEYWAIHL